MPFSSRQSLLWLTAVVQGCCCCGTCAAPAEVWLGPKRERLAVEPGRENRLKCEGQQSFLNRGRLGTGFHPLQLAFAPGRSCSDSAPGAPEGQTCYSQTALLLLPVMHRGNVQQLSPYPKISILPNPVTAIQGTSAACCSGCGLSALQQSQQQALLTGTTTQGSRAAHQEQAAPECATGHQQHRNPCAFADAGGGGGRHP